MAGEVASIIVMVLEYGNLGELRQEIRYYDSADTQTRLISFNYDERSGLLTGYDDGTTTAVYMYDDRGRKLTETVQYPGFSKTFSYTYDAVGLKRSFSMPNGPTYSYTYDAGNNLKTIRIPGVGNIEYPSYTMGRPDSITFPGGSTQTYQYDNLMRIERITTPNLDYEYTSYDGVSNILTKTTEHENYVYEYDDVYRLTGADNPVLPDDAFTYDGVGNRETASNVTIGSITHNINNELEVYGDISYDYDANGNMTRQAVGTTAAILYTYNAANRLVKVEDEVSSTVIAEYYYDPFGRRLWKDVGGTRTYFFYSDEGLIGEYDETGAEIKTYGYKPDSTWTTDPLWLKEDGAYYWYQNDHLGTPQKLVDSSGAVVWSAQYTAFGEAQIEVETVENNLRFPGQYYDAETGLHYNCFRYYHPAIGRYTSADPIGFDSGDIHLYGYAKNNPETHMDAHGLQSQDNVYLPDDATDMQKAFYPSFYYDNLFWEYPVKPCSIEIHVGHYTETPHRFVVAPCAGATVNSCNSNGGIEEYTGLGLFAFPKEFEPAAFPGSQYTVNPVYWAIDDEDLRKRLKSDIDAAKLYAKQLCQECCQCEEITVMTKCYSFLTEPPTPLRYPPPRFPAPIVHKTYGPLYEEGPNQAPLYNTCEENKKTVYSCQR